MEQDRAGRGIGDTEPEDGTQTEGTATSTGDDKQPKETFAEIMNA